MYCLDDVVSIGVAFLRQETGFKINKKLVRDIFFLVKADFEIIKHSFFYVLKLVKKYRIHHKDIHIIIFYSTLISLKFLVDEEIDNQEISELFGIDTKIITSSTLGICEALDWRLHLSDSDNELISHVISYKKMVYPPFSIFLKKISK